MIHPDYPPFLEKHKFFASVPPHLKRINLLIIQGLDPQRMAITGIRWNPFPLNSKRLALRFSARPALIPSASPQLAAIRMAVLGTTQGALSF